MGDDLNFAQNFTRTAADGLALIAKMDDPRAAHDSAVVTDMMTTVQRGAKRLRARHIYTGAQDVLSAMHHEDDATLNGRIVSLGSLVTEYARGLSELLPQNDTVAATPTDKWDRARNTLNEILPTAPAETADMLSRLMRAPVTLKDMRPDEPVHTEEADIVPFAKQKASETAAETQTAVTKAAPKPAPKTTLIDESFDVSLDAMMRDVIADALSVARNVGRTISLSYDMGDKVISEMGAENLRNRLGAALSQIIRQSLKEDRVGHIDINLAGEQLHIMAGTTAIRVAIDPNQAPAAKPIITADTEKGLRAQLDALMDPISIHETAS